MSHIFWHLVGRFLATHPAVVDRLIERAKRTPYKQLDGYMGRWWLVPYADAMAGTGCGPLRPWRRPLGWLLQKFGYHIRIHHILRADHDRDLHDHPADYRTVILRGHYVEEDVFGNLHWRDPGDTVTARAETFHRIAQVSTGGVWTMFIIRKKRHTWGFMVGGRKVPWHKYLSDMNTNF